MPRGAPFSVGVALALSAPFAVPARAASPAEPLGVVVGRGVALPPLLAAARQSGGARWRAESMPVPEPRPAAPDAQLAELERLYLEADNLGCLERAADPALQLDLLIERGQLAHAGRVATLTAACAHGAGDLERAQRTLARAQSAELVLQAALERTKPEVAELAERQRAASVAPGRVALSITTRPAEARVSVDGRGDVCTTPCSVNLLRGEHVVVIERADSARRVERITLSTPRRLAVPLGPASAAEARAQLARIAASRPDLDDVIAARLAAKAFGARVVVIAWSDQGGARAVVYDRARDALVARSDVTDAGQAATAVRAAVTEWRGSDAPKPITSQPLFWGATGVAAVAIGVATYLILKPEPEDRFSFVVR